MGSDMAEGAAWAQDPCGGEGLDMLQSGSDLPVELLEAAAGDDGFAASLAQSGSGDCEAPAFGGQPAPIAAGAKWWHAESGEGVAAADIKATTADDMRQLLREFVSQVSVELGGLEPSEDPWLDSGEGGWAASGRVSGGASTGGEGSAGTRRGDGAATGLGSQQQAGAGAGMDWASSAGCDDAGRLAGGSFGGSSRGSSSSGSKGLGRRRSGASGSFFYYESPDLPPGVPARSAQAKIYALVRLACVIE